MLVLIGCTLVLGVIAGFLSFSADFSWRPVGQIIHGLLSIGCFVLVGAAFWRFGWKIGVLDFFLAIIAANLGLTLQRNFRKIPP
jgi:hypothetical protein